MATGSPSTGALNTGWVYTFRDFLANRPHSGRHQGCHRCFFPMKKTSPVKFMLAAAATAKQRQLPLSGRFGR